MLNKMLNKWLYNLEHNNPQIDPSTESPLKNCEAYLLRGAQINSLRTLSFCESPQIVR